MPIPSVTVAERVWEVVTLKKGKNQRSLAAFTPTPSLNYALCHMTYRYMYDFLLQNDS